MSDPAGSVPTSKGLEFLGAVAGGLVHEIRNPLSTMNVTLQLMQEDWPAEDEDPRAARTARRLNSLLGEVKRLEEILDDFLRYAGIRRLNISQVMLNRVVEEVTGFMLPECARAGVELTFYPDRSMPIMRVDERLLKQALMNLLLNAVQALEGLDEDDGREKQIIVRTRLDGDFARIDVIDTGPGIPLTVQDKVWEVYYSRKRSGSGLGLPMARRVAEEHGGALLLESEPGKGSDFILHLPLAGPDAQPRAGR